MTRAAIVTCLVAFVVSAAIQTAESRTWNVRVDGSGDVPTLQAAIDAAGAGDEIVVHPGRYTWANQGTGTDYGLIRFLRGVGGFSIRSVAGAGSTVLDAQGQGRVIYLMAYNQVTFEGFTITGGEAPLFGDFDGGGIIAHLCPAVFIDCVITRNSADAGGGMWCGGVSSMHFINCEFSWNTADLGGGILYVNSYNTGRLTGCVVRNNTATLRGGGIYVHNNSVFYENTLVVSNDAVESGGGLYITTDSPAVMTNCTVVGNDAATGGGIYLFGGATLDLGSSIVAFNHDGGAFSSDNLSVLTAGCNDVWANGGGNELPANAVDTGGNFSLDPGFCGTFASLDLSVGGDSPCAPGNHPDETACGQIGALGVGCGNVPVRSATWGRIKNLYKD
jgi:predicted outer membrane repeat protein